MRWCRLYSEFATDPKVQVMPEAMQRRLVMLFCLHSEGSLEAMDDETLACAMRITATELQKTKELFVKKGFLEEGGWKPRNWEKRQRSSDNVNERVKRYREQTQRDSNGHVTLQKLKSSGGNAYTHAGAPALSPSVSVSESESRGSPEGGNSPPIHSTDTPFAQKVRDDAVRLWGEIDFDADMQANELIRRWGDKLAAHGLDKAFRALGSKEKPWAWANKVCQGGMPAGVPSRPSSRSSGGPTNQPAEVPAESLSKYQAEADEAAAKYGRSPAEYREKVKRGELPKPKV